MKGKIYRIYLREVDAAGKAWGREFGTDYPTLEVAREVKAQYAFNFPTARYFIRAAQPRNYRLERTETGRLPMSVTN